MKKAMAVLMVIMVILTCFLSACKHNVTSLEGSGIKGDVPQGNGSYDGGIILPPPYHPSPYEKIPNNLKGQTVRFATWINHWETYGKDPLSNFYNDTGLNVELFGLQKESFGEKLKTSIASGDIPDAFQCDSFVGGLPLTLEIAAPIDVVSTVDLTNGMWHKSMMDLATIDGHVYFLNTVSSPWEQSSLILYNKSILWDNGFKTPEEYWEEGTWNWDNMLKCMKEVVQLGPKFYGAYLELDVLAASAGCMLFDYVSENEKFQERVHKKELLMACQFYKDAAEQGLLTDNFEDFINGKCGIAIGTTNDLMVNGRLKDMDWNDVGFTYLPAIDESSTKLIIPSNLVMHGIVAGAPNANAAGYFLSYWLDPMNYSDNPFISRKAANFYFQLTNSEAYDKHFNVEYSCLKAFGLDSAEIYSNAKNAPLNNKTQDKLQEVEAKANELIEKLKAKNK